MKTYVTNYAQAIQLFNDTIKRGAIIGIRCLDMAKDQWLLWWMPKHQQPKQPKL